LYVTATADKSSHATLRNIKHIGSGLENIIDFMMNGVIAWYIYTFCYSKTCLFYFIIFFINYTFLI